MLSPPDGAGRRRLFERRPIRVSLGAQVFVKKGLSSFDPRDPYYFAVTLSWKMFVLGFVGAELAINLVFATLYALQPGAVANLGPHGFASCFFFSLETLATVGYGEMYPATLYAHVVSSIEIMTGVIFTAIVTGLLFVRFSKPKAKVVYADKAVVTRHNGRPTLMIRIANARTPLLHDARISLHMLTRDDSAEGVRHVAVVELPLVRSRIPVFAIIYTLMHVIDEASPLAPFVDAPPETLDTRFFITVIARDPTIGAQVSDIHTIEGSDVVFNARYVDTVSSRGKKVIADYTLLSAIEREQPLSGSEPASAQAAEPEDNAAGPSTSLELLSQLGPSPVD